jgi:hypothetical protein
MKNRVAARIEIAAELIFAKVIARPQRLVIVVAS